MPTAYVVESDYTNFKAWVANGIAMPNGALLTHGGATFLALRKENLTGTSSTLTVFRTTDGINFTEYASPWTGNSTFADWGVSQDGSTLWFLLVQRTPAPAAVSVLAFDLDALSWGSIIACPYTGSTASSGNAILANQGIVTLFYTHQNLDLTFDAHYTTYDSVGNAWGADSTMELNVTGSPYLNIALDPATGNIGVLYNAFTLNIPQPTKVRSLTAGGALSAAVTLNPASATVVSAPNVPGLYIPESDSWAFPVINQSDNNVRIYLATPSVGPGALTFETPNTPVSTVQFVQPCLQRDGSDIVLLYESNNGSISSTLAVLSQRRAASGGAWSSAATLFNRVTGTYAPAPNLKQRDQGGFMGCIGGGDTLVSLEAGLPGASMNEYLVTIAAPGLACPLANTGTIGNFYSSALQESGGVGPFTYSIVS